MKKFLRTLFAVFAAASILSACGGGGGGSDVGGGGDGGGGGGGTTPATYALGGTVAGLKTGQSVTLLNGAATMTAGNGTFAFPVKLQAGTSYSITAQNPPGMTCAVSNGSGVMPAADVNNVTVNCAAAPTYTLGGTVNGLTSGQSVTLLNGTDTVATGNGAFTFNVQVPVGVGYNVTAQSPSGMSCAVSNGSGVMPAANVSNVTVNCTTASTYTLGGTVTGLTAAQSVTLLNNGAGAITVGSGTFTFPVKPQAGASYNVTAQNQPGMSCTVKNGSGVMPAANVTNIAVSCVVAPTYTLGGTVSGLTSGQSVTLTNVLDTVTVGNGTFTFGVQLSTGTSYSVTAQNPPGMTCAVSNGSGTMPAANVTNVAVNCVANAAPTFTLGGNVTGLGAGQTVTLLNNGVTALTIGNGPFTLPTQLQAGTSYNITAQNPSGMTCTVTNGSSVMPAANVNNVAVNCTVVPTFTLGGTVNGLGMDQSITLHNGTDTVTTGNGTFTFSVKLPAGANYNVTADNPSGLVCTVSNGNGAMPANDKTNVAVSCVTDPGPPPATYTLGGTITGLGAGQTVEVCNVAAPFCILGITSISAGNGPFTIQGTPGNNYNVAVFSAPGTTCVVSNGSGVMPAANVTNVAVSCVVGSTYTLGGTVSGLPDGSQSVILHLNINVAGIGSGEETLSGNSYGYAGGNSAFTFSTPLPAGASYSITADNPPGTTCVVSNGSGDMPAANVNNVAVNCTVNP